uniref:FIST C-domain domain-containing protein n=1 Tax=Salix viminalis TaxID=40686 RepID=A0A6N2MDK7_SALVM
MAEQLSGERMSGFSLVDEKIVKNILSRLPALTFANAACVNKCWYKICSQILKRPKLASALSLNPSLHDAVKEVIEQVLSEPIRPHFAIACISKEFNLKVTHGLIIEKLGSRIPIITNVSSGIIGVDGIANELVEKKWETTSGPNIQESDTAETGLVLLVGFLPGLKIGTIPLFQPIQEPNTMVENFVMNILNYTAAVSDCAAPVGIIMFGDKTTDMKPIVAKMDCAIPEETIIVGDASADFIFRTGDNSLNQLLHSCCFQAVALVFARDRYKPEGLGEIQFHVTKSTGVLPFGPNLEAVGVVLRDSERSCLIARLEGHNSIIASGAILNEIEQQFREEDMFADLFIGVTKETQRTSDSGILTPGKSLYFYKVIGRGEYYFTVNGIGIKPGDSFLFYQSDSDTASSSCDNAFNKLLALKAELKSKNHFRLSNLADKDDKEEVLGGFIFSCYDRDQSFIEESFGDSYPFCDIFPTAPVAGLFCRGEIGRGPKSLMNEEYDDETCPRCCVHVYSTIYLVMSYLPPPLEGQSP